MPRNQNLGTLQTRLAAAEAQAQSTQEVTNHFNGVIRNIHWGAILLLAAGLGTAFIVLTNRMDDTRKEIKQDMKDMRQELMQVLLREQQAPASPQPQLTAPQPPQAP